MIRARFVTRFLSLVLFTAGWFAPAVAQTVGQPVLGLLQGTNVLVRFNTNTPGMLGPPIAGFNRPDVAR